jgi:hypothetical protein
MICWAPHLSLRKCIRMNVSQWVGPRALHLEASTEWTWLSGWGLEPPRLGHFTKKSPRQTKERILWRSQRRYLLRSNCLTLEQEIHTLGGGHLESYNRCLLHSNCLTLEQERSVISFSRVLPLALARRHLTTLARVTPGAWWNMTWGVCTASLPTGKSSASTPHIIFCRASYTPSV